MKSKILLLALFSTIIFTSCMTVKWTPVSFAPDEFVKVYEVDGSKDALFLKSNEWMISIFNNATSVIQHTDKAEGVIIGKYLMHGTVTAGAYGTTVDSRIYAIIDIRVKDGKARLSIKPEDWRYYKGLVGVPYTKDLALIDMNALADAFQKYIGKKEVQF